ncbi:hypothetical protein B484DRAFT_476719 [Ochromonadaceae sp. CCMP2298]|nr:hypothetical protein B484DRAFT_476719 [Ochromonadaceae sp. CCMP2298]
MNFTDGVGFPAFSGVVAEECFRMDREDAEQRNDDSQLLCSCSKYSVVASGCALSIFNASQMNADQAVAEIELNASVVCVTWDLTESCMIVGDASGTLHLVTTEGSLLFSKKVVTDSTRICHMQFLAADDSLESQTLVVISENGSVLCIQSMEILKMCAVGTQPQALPQLLQLFRMIKMQLPSATVHKAEVFEVEGVEEEEEVGLRVVLLDAGGAVGVACLGPLSRLRSPDSLSTVATSTSGEEVGTVSDFCLMGEQDGVVLCLLVAGEQLLMVDLGTPAEGPRAHMPLQRGAHKITSAVMATAECARGGGGEGANGEEGQEGGSTYVAVSALVTVAVRSPASATSPASSAHTGVQLVWAACLGGACKLMGLTAGALDLRVAMPAVGATPGPMSTLRADTGRAQAAADKGGYLALREGELIYTRCSSALRSAATALTAAFLVQAQGQAVSLTQMQGQGVLAALGAATAAVLRARLSGGSSESGSFDVDGCLAAMGASAGGVDSVALAHLLLLLPHPTQGRIAAVLLAAELAVERCGAKPAAKQRCQLEILRLHHLCETVELSMASDKPLSCEAKAHHAQAEMGAETGAETGVASGGAMAGAAREELLRRGMLALLPASIGQSLFAMLRTGQIRRALLVAHRCIHGPLPLDAAQSLRLLPDSAAVEDVLAWVREGLVPRFGAFNCSSGASGPSAAFTAIARELAQRARRSEELRESPFDAVKLVDAASDLMAAVPLGSPESLSLSQELQLLHSNLVLQRALWEQWDDPIRLAEVDELGLRGLVFDRIDALDEGALVADLRTAVVPLVTRFGGDADALLMGWITESIATRIVLAGADAEAEAQTDMDMDHSETCSLSRLVKVASSIRDRNAQAKMVLTLLQMPVLEQITLNSATHFNGEEAEEMVLSERTATGTKGALPVVLHVESTTLLCELAAAAAHYVDGATRDALTEATRLLKIKALAASYGVHSFEPRNGKHIRTVVAIIAASTHRPSALPDAVEFACSLGSNSVDLSAVLTRALVQRATDPGVGAAQEAELNRALSLLPPERALVVVEDALTFLLDQLEEESDSILFEPGAQGMGRQAEREEQVQARASAEVLVRGAIVLTLHYLDVTREEWESVGAGAKAGAGVAAGVGVSMGLGVGGAGRVERQRVLGTACCWICSELLLSLKRISALQTAHGIYLCVCDLANVEVCQAVLAKVARAKVQQMLADENQGLTTSPPLSAPIRKVCVLLGVCATYFTHSVMKLLVEAGQTERAVEVARMMSREKLIHASSVITSAAHGDTPYGTPVDAVDQSAEAAEEASLLLDAAVTLCTIAARKANQISPEDCVLLPSLPMGLGGAAGGGGGQVPEYLSFPMASFQLSRDLLKCSVSSCPSRYLGRTLDLLSGSDTVLAVYERVEGAAACASAFSSTPSSSSGNSSGSASFRSVTGAGGEKARAEAAGLLSEGVFARDGILMQASVVAMPLMRYALGEVQRRGGGTGAYSGPSGSNVGGGAPADLEDLVRILQRSENHLLATRILFGSRHNSAAKAALLKGSLLSLCRKVLIYRDLDVPFSVACLAALPYDTMVRELKSAVPSIQSDFSRLQTVAMVGEELSHLWDQEPLLLLFQQLQTNAKWWNLLSALGLKVDLRVFQSPDAEQRERLIRSIIPELFEKGHLDLDTVTEYCRQFDLEPEYAALTYTQQLLTSAPRAIGDFAWVSRVRAAAENVEERALLGRLRELLPQVHPLDYEKIRFVCTWILDLLSAEEEPEEQEEEQEEGRARGKGCGRGEDADLEDENSPSKANTSLNRSHRGLNKSGTASVRDGPQKIPTALLKAERGLAAELEQYRKYFDIAGYLSGLKFPREATSAIVCLPTATATAGMAGRSAAGAAGPGSAGSAGVESAQGVMAQSPYATAGSAYQERIPLWQLLSAPWSVLDPLLTHMPESAGKISPLCLPLGIDKNQFNARKIMALYSRMTASTDGETALASQREVKTAAISAAAEAIEGSLSSPAQQVQLWRWIYTRELRCGDDEQAEVALRHALKVATQYPTLPLPRESEDGRGGSVDRDGEGGSLLAHLRREMRTLQCEQTVKQFNLLLSDAPRAGQLLLSTIASPTLLLRYLFEITAERCWDLHTAAAVQSGLPSTAYSFTLSAPAPAALEFVAAAAKVIAQIAQHCGLDVPVQQEGQAAATQLELLRHSLVGRMLSDVDSNGHNGAANSHDASTAGAIGTQGALLGGGRADPRRGFWGEDSTYNPSAVERRRREDLYLSLSIAVLVLTCGESAQRQAYTVQLDSVLRGRGIRVMRRLTARSKYRAVQALLFLEPAPGMGAVGAGGADAGEAEAHRQELLRFKSYVYCLAEMQEIRLPCTEDSLLDAMGLRLLDFRIVLATAVSDPRPLVRTWVHDEGAHVDVVELCRDLLAATDCRDVSIWYHLIGHMVAKGLGRSLQQTLLALFQSSVFADLCFGTMGADLVDALSKVGVEALERAEQILKVASLREGDAESGAEWLHVATDAAAGAGQAGASVGAGAVAGTSSSGGKSSSGPGAGTGSGGSLSSAELAKRVCLRPRLARGPGEWAEGAPEDVLQSLSDSAMLVAAVLHATSSRVRARCAGSVETLKAAGQRVQEQLEEAQVGQMGATGGSGGTEAVATSRSVATAVRQGLQLCSCRLAAL